jgi:ATP-dependent helicase HepA
METPQIGQRWLVDTDASLGLGLVVECEGRSITLEFPATGDIRQYAIKHAPLTRAIFSEGELIETVDGTTHRVSRVENINDLLIYIDEVGEPIPETQLAANIQLNHPLKRLLATQLDKPSWFDVREQLSRAYQQWLRSDVIGLMGARISLTPHQLYVAQSATSRLPVRVLLADEVGLGKTIEAGLILQRLQLQAHASRVLILVPEALCVQWFVEMLRCFSIYCSLIDSEIDTDSDGDTDLNDTRVFIASHDFLNEERSLAADHWDMVIVDEAHHFNLSELGQESGKELEETSPYDEEASPDKEAPTNKEDSPDKEASEQAPSASLIGGLTQTHQSNQLRKLAAHTTHLLLLSATPERLGLKSHFSRLQLLDSEKFHSFEEFEAAYESYQALADDLQELLAIDDDDNNSVVSDEQLVKLAEHFSFKLNSDFNSVDAGEASNNTDASYSGDASNCGEATISKKALTELLLDSYGTGRMIYRNTRHGVPGFPKRKLMTHKIDGDDEKFSWLVNFVKRHQDEKLLLITHDKEDVLELKESLYRKTGIDCPVFHEDMTLIERDRAAAYFADSDDEGAPLLLCSEIGSEGRNFQFCHRLVCWDLPEHPDVLEQRIGRLDRIGQTQDIEIHVCVESELAEQRLHWFHDILSSIEQINPAAGLIHDQWYDKYCENPTLVEPEVRSQLQAWLQQLEQGRDRLLEMNSCRQPDANNLLAAIEQHEAENHPQKLLEKITDVLNIHYEPLGDSRYRLVPSDQMLVPMIPGIPAEGCEITFDRTTATSREDIEFITWDHPLMQGLFEMISLSDLGVASIGLLPNKSLKPGMLFAEVLFSLSVQSAHARQIQPYLTESGLRVVVTTNNANNISAALPSEKLIQIVETAGKKIRKAVVTDYRTQISTLLDQAELLAEVETQKIINASLIQLNERAHIELARLKQLQQRNSDISDQDVDKLSNHFSDVREALKSSCKPMVSAIRLLVTYRP